jgi:hypothetical protein
VVYWFAAASLNAARLFLYPAGFGCTRIANGSLLNPVPAFAAVAAIVTGNLFWHFYFHLDYCISIPVIQTFGIQAQ